MKTSNKERENTSSDKELEESKDDTVVENMFLLLLSIVTLFYRALILKLIFNWFITEFFSVGEISFAVALVILIIKGFFLQQSTEESILKTHYRKTTVDEFEHVIMGIGAKIGELISNSILLGALFILKLIIL